MRAARRLFDAVKSSISVPWSTPLERQLETYSKYKIHRLTLQEFMDFGRRTDKDAAATMSCNFIHTEASIRLAHMLQEIRTLPSAVLSQPAIKRVYNWYLSSFKDLVDFPPAAAQSDHDAYLRDFSALLENILLRHRATVITTAVGMRQLHRQGALRGREDYITGWLDRFLTSRISIRFLFNQHLALFSGNDTNESPRSAADGDAYRDMGSRWVGAIDSNVVVSGIATDAAENARHMCYDLYGDAPSFEIVRPRRGKSHIPFAYIPSHLYHILFELLKNAMRATVETHSEHRTCPPIKIIIVKSPNDLTVKICDEGGGIGFRDIPNLFNYFYSTAPEPEVYADDFDTLDLDRAPLAGFGYGLPISRLYCNYFGGDLRLNSVDGYGTDCFVYLPTVANEAMEVLPSFDERELQYYRNRHDWKQLR